MTHTKHHVDHTHCWKEDNPPCGQKIEHLKCCLCEKLNPKITTNTIDACIEVVESKWHTPYRNDTEEEKAIGEIYNQALDDIIKDLKALK